MTFVCRKIAARFVNELNSRLTVLTADIVSGAAS
jgi:hypothetical protein